MTTLAQLQTQQTAAGTTYNSAVTALYAAWVNLAALDQAIANAKVGGGQLTSFGFNMDELRATLASHPLATPVSPQNLVALVATARDGYVAGWTSS